ncbi:hypothetical protein BU25DRAFT_474477 [Macroventuria anomochaeta]|uniref:Uncharacterized protein n=1 Tax=Macroventuria anomochaeta TaxID=301207 RepID=A0ACB6RV05_9PLEO|nr:uncharacterized protein BU25DRAFT_474477 [Macroventuria anomochaeta]KAF2624959.1 hypothetical protein BU25DRAFT_474477 [Macroventuria anomochaeta]
MGEEQHKVALSIVCPALVLSISHSLLRGCSGEQQDSHGGDRSRASKRITASYMPMDSSAGPTYSSVDDLLRYWCVVTHDDCTALSTSTAHRKYPQVLSPLHRECFGWKAGRADPELVYILVNSVFGGLDDFEMQVEQKCPSNNLNDKVNLQGMHMTCSNLANSSASSRCRMPQQASSPTYQPLSRSVRMITVH